MAFDGYKFKFKFNASHYIDAIRPETIHSHTFHIILYLENDNNNFIVYNEIEKNINKYLDRYRGKCLNFVYPFDKITPTLENLCKEMYQKIENYCNSIGIILDKLSISDNSLLWYSLGNGILIDSLNENITEDIFMNYIKRLKQKYSFIEINKDDDYNSNVFDELECSLKTNNNNNMDNLLQKYLEKDNVMFFTNNCPSPHFDKRNTILQNQ